LTQHRDTVDAWITKLRARNLEVDKSDEDVLKDLLTTLGLDRLGCFFRPFQQEPLHSAGKFRRPTNFRKILTVVQQEEKLKELVLAGCTHVELRLEYELVEAYRAQKHTEKFLNPKFYGTSKAKEDFIREWIADKGLGYEYNDDGEYLGLQPYSFGQKVNLLVQTGFSELDSGARKAGIRVSDALGQPTSDPQGKRHQAILTLAVDLHYVKGLRNIVSHNTVLWENKLENSKLPAALIKFHFISEISSSMEAIEILTKVLDQMDKKTHAKPAGAIANSIRALVGAPGLFVAGLENSAEEHLKKLEAEEDESVTVMPPDLGNTQSLDGGRQP